MTDEHVIDDLGAYVLESLEAQERTRVETHVVACEACARLLAEYRGVSGALPLGLAPATPPPAAWIAIRTAARAQTRRGTGRALPSWLRRARWPALAALAASLVVWNVALQRELVRYRSGPQVEALSRRPGRVVVLAGAGQPEANARLFVASDGGHGHMAITGLRALPPERVYQVWFVRAAASPVAGATFMVDARGRAWVSVDIPSLDDVRTIVVTEEPASGSTALTGTPLLAARPWR